MTNKNLTKEKCDITFIVCMLMRSKFFTCALNGLPEVYLEMKLPSDKALEQVSYKTLEHNRS